MSININLLPPEIKMQWAQKRRQQKILATGSVIIILLLFVFSSLLLTTFQTRAEVAGLQKERQVLEKQLPALEQYAKLQSRVVQSERILKQAVGTPPNWASVLNDIGQYIPVNDWLTDFSGTYKHTTAHPVVKKQPENQITVTDPQVQSLPGIKDQQAENTPLDGEVVIRGYTYDHQSMADWLQQIRKVSGLTGVSCLFSAEENMDGKNMIRFEIKAQILPGLPLQPAGPKAGGL